LLKAQKKKIMKYERLIVQLKRNLDFKDISTKLPSHKKLTLK